MWSCWGDVELVVSGDVDVPSESIMAREIPMLNGGKCLLSRGNYDAERKISREGNGAVERRRGSEM